MYKFTEKELKECKDFSQAVDVSLYAARNKSSLDKRIFDSFLGKLGEIAIYNYLKDKIEDLSYPDMKIYKTSEKSWDFDLKGKGCNIHVKSQDIAQGEKYGVSWIFQYGNGKNRNYDKEIFDQISPDQYVAFVSVNPKENSAIIRSICKLNFLHEKNIWKEPVLQHLKIANKLAVYLKDLEFYPKELFSL